MKITIEGNTVDGSARSTLNVVLSGARGPAGEAGASEWGDIGGTLSEQTDLQAALDAKVPYTGATQDVNLGEFGLLTGNVEFDTTPTNAPTTAGSMSWNDTDGTVNLVLKGGNVISKLGETQHIRAYNNTGTAIARGKVVYVSGAQGQRLTVALADADTEILSKDTIGFTAESIADGAEGFVIIAGVLSNMNTSGMADGATVFLSQTAGGYTTTPPVDPAHLVILGFIVNGGSGGAGSIYVKVDNGYELEELHGVADTAKVTPVAADALLLRDSADNNLWKRLTWTNALAGVKTHMDTFKGVAGGYASLDGSGKIPSTELPSYVDDVIEVANFAALPVAGETGKIYVTLDTNKCYRWSGSVYVEVSQGIDTLTTTGTSGAATLVGSTLNIPQYQSVLTNPVTGTGTSGQVSYWSGTTTQTGSSAFVFDAVNQRVGIGTNAPSAKLDIINTIADVHTFKVRASGTPLPSFTIEDGDISIPNYSGGGVNPSIASNEVGRIASLGSAIGGLQIFGFSNQSDERALFITAVSGKTTATSNPIFLFRSQKHDGLTSFTDLSSTDIAFGWTNRNTRIAQMFGNGNMLLQNGGTFTDNGQRLQVYGSTLLRGSGTTSATTALLVQNSTPTELFKVADNGLITIGTISSTNTINFGSDNTQITRSSINDSFSFRNVRSAATIFQFITNSNLSNANTSGTNVFLSMPIGYEPTSGTGTWTQLSMTATINQTGGANGITRGLYVNPTLTSAADWRGIESVAASNANHTLLKLRNATVDVFTVKSDSKIGFFNATPVAQPTTGIAEAAFVENSGSTAVNVDSTFAGYTIQQIAQALKDIGLLA